MKFEIGKTYKTRSIGDHDCVFAVTILGRTAKSVTIEYNGRRIGRRIFQWDGVECIMPYGRYSMAPTIRADRMAV